MISATEFEQIEQDLAERFPPPAVVEVTPDQFAGVRLVIVSEEFLGMSQSERRAAVLSAVPDDKIAYLALLGPDEYDGESSVAPEVESLPLWPEALAKGQQEKFVLNLPSQNAQQLKPPVVATFYSLRGGVGRSTALAHTARSLAAQGLRVVCMDMDLEAPGLAALFEVENYVTDDTGVVPLLLWTETGGQIPDVAEHVLRVSDEDDLHLLPAGKPDANYARRLALLDPVAWYEEEVNPLQRLLDAVSEIPQRPHVVLIDSRTGISPLAAPLLFDIADINIITFYPHPQAKAGTAALTKALLAARSRRDTGQERLSPEIRFLISPIPAMAEIKSFYTERAHDWIEEWLEKAHDAAGNQAFSDLDEIVEVITQHESIATSDSAMDLGPHTAFKAPAAWIAGLVEPEGAQLHNRGDEQGEPSKSSILEDLTFADDTAEAQTREGLIGTFLSTADVRNALRTETPIVRGRKGTGKTAIFRKLADEPESIVITSPTGVAAHKKWIPGSDFYSELEDFLKEHGLEWRQAWPGIIGLAMLRHVPNAPHPTWIDDPIKATRPDPTGGYTTIDLLDDLEALLAAPKAPMRISEWVQQLDRELPGPRLLLFDGLDTGFGSHTHADRQRRNDSVAGLLTVTGSLGPQLEKLSFKVMLREDIWRDVSLPNKSHLESRSARLRWSNQTDYLRVVLKQALRSAVFANLVAQRLDPTNFALHKTPIEYWPDDFVRSTWFMLVGERVSGGKTSYTDNWVWSRLADANGDHSPRSLTQLMARATELEREFEETNQKYPRSIIRPGSLVKALDDVSEPALDAFRTDEFPELGPVFDQLRTVTATPFDAVLLSADPNLVELAREVGLLEAITGPSGEHRFRIPELYRKALNIGRKGPK